jgi:hypothetical protein
MHKFLNCYLLVLRRHKLLPLSDNGVGVDNSILKLVCRFLLIFSGYQLVITVW